MKYYKFLIMIILSGLIVSGLNPLPGNSPVRAETEPVVQTDSVNRLSGAINEFGFDLLKELSSAESHDNVFTSPVSVHLALEMTYMGAEGKTEKEMKDALKIDELEKCEAAALANRLMDQLGRSPDSNVDLANSIWAREGLPFKKVFLEIGEDLFDARVLELDFSSQKAVKTINEWVKANTGGKIDRIVKQLNPLDVMVLLNAIYFEAPWSEQFKEENTEEGPFYLEAGSQKDLPMMSQSGSFRFLKTEDFKLIRLPYGKTESLAAYILLPEEKFGLRELTDRITGKSWKSWLSRLSQSRGRIVLPRFELSYEKELNEPLKDLGMELAFDRTRADLTGIIDLPTQNAYISKVRHKTLLEVTEQGTKAAGATSVKIGLTSLGPSEDSFNMVVDHPFLFAIRDEKSGALLFLGNIRNPRKVGKN